MQGKLSPESPQNWGRTVRMDLENRLESERLRKEKDTTWETHRAFAL